MFYIIKPVRDDKVVKFWKLCSYIVSDYVIM